jgi:chemotaxis protein MotB
MARSRRDLRASGDIWPGFVDALSTLLLVIIFLLVVFVLGQFFLNQLLEGRDEQVQRLERTVAELSGQLDDERRASADLRRTLTQTTADMQMALADRDDLASQLAQAEAERDTLSDRLVLLTDEQALLQRTLQEMRTQTERSEQQVASLQEELDSARETIAADRETIELQLGQLVQLRRDIETLQQVRAELEGEVADLALALESEATTAEELREARAALLAELGSERDRASVLEAELADSEERTMLAQRELAERELRIEELLRSAAQVEERFALEQDARSASEEQVARLSEQIRTLVVQLTALEQALDVKQEEIDRQSLQIAELGERLNFALAERVEELSRFRSDFFGKLSQVLGDRADVRIVGDRFVFQSEVLFPTAEATLDSGGRQELVQLADTLKEIMDEIPDDLPWVLQINGHTDRRPISTVRFPSNWELSSARAISVAQVLIDEGIPPDRIATAGFAEFQPLDEGDDEIAYRRNRRIEIKLTSP